MSDAPFPKQNATFDAISREELRTLVEELDNCEAHVIEKCVQFFLAETKGLWHNRARAAISRRLKHCVLGRTH